MSETVFIFGAGASHSAGAPLMGNFIDVARRIRPEMKGETAAAFDLVFRGISALQLAHSKSDIDLYNLESVFAAFEMARLFGRDIGSLKASEIANLSNAIRQVIVATLEAKLEFPLVRFAIQRN